VKPKLVAAAAAAALAFGLALAWAPTAGRRAQALENQAERAIARRDIQVSPAELTTLMHNRQVALALFDLRDEFAFSQFHLADAKRVDSMETIRALPDKTVKFRMAADEETALRAFRQLARAGAKQVYILVGGIAAWLELFANTSSGTPTLLAGAFGGRHPASYPDVEHMALPKFEAKVKLGASGAKKGPGGCGG
jgi:rhodanese-related sulfurtransferase